MVQYSTFLPAWLLLAACSYYYIGWAEKPQHLLFYAAALGVLWQYRGEVKNCLKHPLMQVLGGYVAYQIISTCWSPIGNAEEIAETLRKGTLGLLFLLGFALCWQREWFREQWLSVMVVIATVSAALALGLHDMSGRLEGLGRSINAVQAGCLYGFALLLAAWRIRQHKAWAVCWLVLFCALLETASRGALLAAVTGHLLLLRNSVPLPQAGGAREGCRTTSEAVIYFDDTPTPTLPRKRERGLSVFCALAAMGGVGMIVVFPELLQRADGFRFLIWQEAWQQVRGDWLLGLGYRTPFAVTLPYGQTIYQPHSIYITALYYGGAVGVAALLAVMAAAWRASQQPLTRALLIFAAIIGLFDFNLLLVNGEIEWLLFWLPWAMVVSEKSNTMMHQTEQGEARSGGLRR